MSAMTWVSSTATNFSFFFSTGLDGAGSVPNSFCQKLRTCFASETISSTVFLTSMKEVLASLYSLHPCLIAATQAFAAKRILIGSIFHLMSMKCKQRHLYRQHHLDWHSTLGHHYHQCHMYCRLQKHLRRQHNYCCSMILRFRLECLLLRGL